MFVNKKPLNGILHGMFEDIDKSIYDVYYIKTPTLSQKMYYMNFNSSFYVYVPTVTYLNSNIFPNDNTKENQRVKYRKTYPELNTRSGNSLT